MSSEEDEELRVATYVREAPPTLPFGHGLEDRSRYYE